MRTILYNDYPRFVLYCEDGKLWTYESGEVNPFEVPFKVVQIETANDHKAVIVGVDITGEHVVYDIYGVTRSVVFDKFRYTIEYSMKTHDNAQGIVMKKVFFIEPYCLDEE